MIKKIFRVFFLLILLAAAIGFYGWYQLGNIVDETVRKLPPEWRVSYTDRWVNLKGQIELTDLDITHGQIGNLLTAKKFVYTPDRFVSLLTLKNDIILDQYPETGHFQFQEANIPVESLSKSIRSPSDIRLIKLLAKGCGDKQDFGLLDVAKNEMENLSGKIEFNYQYSTIAAELKLESSVAFQRFGSFESQVHLYDAVVGSDRSPYIAFAQWVFFDPLVIKIRNQYCARLNQQTVAEFNDYHVDQVTQFLRQQAVTLDEKFVDRYRQFTHRPENIALTLSPQTGIRLNRWDELTYANIVDDLGVAFNINGQAVDKIIADIDEIQIAESEQLEEIPDEKPEFIVYRSPTVSTLKKFVRQYVTISTDKEEYDGRLLSASGSVVKFEVRAHGGYATLRLKPSDIVFLKVDNK